VSRLTSASQERALVQHMADVIAAEYRGLAASAAAVAAAGGPVKDQTVARWRRISQRDYFPPGEREQAPGGGVADG
jgi:hypothetical protein